MMTNKKNELCIKIAVLGIGGAGNNTINRMLEKNISNIKFIGINTDLQTLSLCKAKTIIQIGKKLTNGLGSGSNPIIGEKAAEENIEEIKKNLQNIDIIFITCGMGGGTGTGASYVIAKIAKDIGILTIGIVTKPFKFEANVRMSNALFGIKKLKKNIDTLIIIQNDKLLKIVNHEITIQEAFKKIDKILQHAIYGISDLINYPALINLDFADIKSIMVNKGIAYIGIGKGKGNNKAKDAIQKAIFNPLLENTINGLLNIIINIFGDVSLKDINDIVNYIKNLNGDNSNIIFGVTYNNKKSNYIKVTIIATELNNKNIKKNNINEYDLKNNKNNFINIQQKIHKNNIIKQDIKIPDF